MTNINFSAKFKYANILSLVLFSISIIFITFKGLNYGIDFKGGTLIELRSNLKVALMPYAVYKNIKSVAPLLYISQLPSPHSHQHLVHLIHQQMLLHVSWL